MGKSVKQITDELHDEVLARMQKQINEDFYSFFVDDPFPDELTGFNNLK